MKRALSATAIFLLTAIPSFAHRLDQYLQGTIISVEKNRVDVQITLTPGVAIFPALIADIDTDRNGLISAGEQHAYAARLLSDLSLKIDGQGLKPQLLSIDFPTIEEMQEGRGEIRLELNANLPHGGTSRKLIFENHHQSRIAAYQVNALVPRDPDIRILAQNRNYSQSFYELDFAQGDLQSGSQPLPWLTGTLKPLGLLALLLAAWMAWRYS